MSRGGRRPGQGRRAADGAKNVMRVTLLLEPPDHDKLARLGQRHGMSHWVRQAIRAEPEPAAKVASKP